jgi:NAD(P)-dependent dehydrogenase (short-subunit alcohol dehydrogenase family)
MKIVIIGATGTIGRAVAAALSPRHEVIAASRHGTHRVDLQDQASVNALLNLVGPIDAVVSAAGGAAYKPLTDLAPADFQASFDDKLMGQINLARTAVQYLRDNGSITLTSGWWSMEPVPSVAAIATVNAALEGFTRAAALELPRGLRINTVSPPLVGTAEWAGRRPVRMTAEDVAKGYIEAIEGGASGRVIDTRPYASWPAAA